MSAPEPKARVKSMGPVNPMHANRVIPVQSRDEINTAEARKVSHLRVATQSEADATDLDTLNEIVAVILSKLIADNNSREPKTGHLCHALARYGREALPSRSGRKPAPHPELPEGPWPTGAQGLRKLNTTQRALKDELLRRRHDTGDHATLDRAVLEAFVPAELWPVVQTMVNDGLADAAARAERALRTYSLRQLPATKRRRAGRPANGTVAIMAGAFQAVFKQFVHLRTLYPECSALAPWMAAPKLSIERGPPAGQENSAPPLSLARLTWQSLNQTIAERLQQKEGESELAALERMSSAPLLHSGLFVPLRARVTLGLLVIIGARIQALADLSIDDVIREWHGPAPDHLCGPAIRLRPGKTLHRDHERIKPIPPGLLNAIDVYLRYLELAAEIIVCWDIAPSTRIVERTLSTPLLVRARQVWTPWRTDRIRMFLSGRTPSNYGGRWERGAYPLISRIAGVNPDHSPELRQFVGYTPHEYRHLASQVAERAGKLWNEKHPATGGDSEFTPGMYAAALLDHDMPEHRLRALYGDRNRGDTRTLLAGRATYGIWDLLTTDEGARRRPDVDKYRDVSRLAGALDAERKHLQDRLERTAVAGKAPAADPQRLLLEMADFSQQVARVNDQLDRARQRLDDLKHDQTTWIAIPDDAPDPGPVDFECLNHTVEENADQFPRVTSRVRDFLTPRELAELAGRGAQSTVTRWMKGEHLPSDPRLRPWEADAIPVDESLGPRYRRILVDRIKDSFWVTETMRRRRDEILSDWPTGSGWRTKGLPNHRCLAPLSPPDSSRE
jgi:hypothetical protein